MPTTLPWLLALALGVASGAQGMDENVPSDPIEEAAPVAEYAPPMNATDSPVVKPTKAAPGATTSRPFPVPARKSFFQRYKRELYALLALLTLWLIARLLSGPEQVETRRPPTRHSPVSAEELGRTVFAVARGENFDAYRVLYLSGSEAIQVLGPSEGQRYIGRRTFEALQAAFEVLVEQIPHGTVYVSTELRNTGQCVMTVRNAFDEKRAIPLGSVAQVGAVMRIVEPGIGPVPAEPMPFLDDDSITELKA